MRKVKNRKVITNISKKSLKSNKSRNIVAIFAIALTALMFTALFTIGASMLKTMEDQTCRQVGTSAHGGYKYMTQEQYDTIAANPMVKDISYNILVGDAQNPALQKTYTEIRYSEDKSAEWGFTLPTTGTMPKEKMDLATSTDVLDALSIPHELGMKVPLTFTVDGKTYQEVFTLCGFWQQDPVNPANEAFLSREYVDLVAPVNSVSIYDRELNPDNPYAGTINANLWLNNSFNIEGKVDKLNAACGYQDGVNINSGVNWAYSTAEIDFQSAAMVILVLLLIMISGYLIIFNIFYISVAKDTRYYGLLKTVGTTGKQLKRIVHRQALLLSCIGIPLGLLLGYLTGRLLTPVVMSIFDYYTSAVDRVSANPFIFIGGAMFALLTVFISAARPARKAAKISPMEALRYNEVVLKKKRDCKTGKVSVPKMGIRNVFRSKKKTVIVILSLSLSIILLNSVYAVTKSFDMDKYLENSITGDFDVATADLFTRYEATSTDPNVARDLAGIDGVEGSGKVYFSENSHQLSAAGEKNVDTILAEYQDTFPEGSQEALARTTEGGITDAHVYGIDQLVFDKLNIFDGKIDWKKFQSGDYLISSTYDESDSHPYYHTGDKVTIDYGDGTSKEYTVMAVGNLPYPAGCMHSHIITPEFVLPSEEYLRHYPDAGPLHVLLEVEDINEDKVEQAVAAYCENTDLSYVSKATLAESLKGVQRMYAVVGGALSGILALIGLLNFINSMATSIHSRRRELAMLQSVGMTTRQLRKMLIWEGMTYVGLTAAFCLTIGLVLSVLLTYGIAGVVWFFSFHFTAIPMLLAIPIMALFAWLIPLACYKNACKESIVERLRETI